MKGLTARRMFLLALLAVFVAATTATAYYIIWPRVMSQRAVSALASPALPARDQKLLVVAPHPDDETIGVGGYIALALRAGAQVRVLLVTDGNKYHNEGTRYTEFKQATGVLGLSESGLVFLGLPDGGLDELPTGRLSDALQAQLDSYDPDIVLYPDFADRHPDHAAIGKVMRALNAVSRVRRTAYEYLVHFGLFYPAPYRYAPYLFLAPPTELLKRQQQWLCLMLPADIENLKRTAIDVYQSQMRNVELRNLFLASVRKNELLSASP